MCGIFAWAGKNPKQFDQTQLNVLGIMNEKRGEHSCGVAVDGDIVIGVDKNKVFRDFLAQSGYTSPVKLPAVLGHTRHATFGAHTVANAHPFGFGNHEDYYEFIGVHNGSLLNHEELAKDYNIPLTVDRTTDSGAIIKRTKIDSEVLLEILYKTKNYKVLSKYDGAAALVWTDTKEPNVTYYYHGKSRKTDYFAEGNTVEERPLYYYQKSPTEVYVSSIEFSLYAIGGDGDTVGEFDHNTVYKVTNGNIKKAVKTKIARTGRFQTGTKSSAHATYQRHSKSSHTPTSRARYGGGKLTRQSDRPQISADSERGKKLFASNIYKDTPTELINNYGNRIYMNKLRYWRTGHLITGIYTWVDGFGFYYLGENEKEADKRFFDLVNKTFSGQDFVNDPTKLVGKAKEKAFVPFHSTTVREITSALKFYMVEGIRVKTSIDYYACLDLIKSAPGIGDWSSLSHCSVHPVIDVGVNSKRYDQQEILLNDVPFSDIICPLGSDKIYTIVNGNCTEVQTLTDPALNIVHDLNEVTKDLEEHEARVESGQQALLTASQVIDQEADLDRLEDDIEEMFKDSLRRFPGFIKRLKKYKDIQRGAEALEILDTFIKDAQKLITVDLKE